MSATGWERCEISDVLAAQNNGKLLKQGWSPKCEKHPARTDSDWGVLKTTSIQSGSFLSGYNKALPDSLHPRPGLEVAVGDLLVTCAGPRSRCGVACLVRSTRPRLMISGKMYKMRASPQVLPAFAEAWLLTSEAQRAVDRMKTGGSDSGLNLTQGRFLRLPFLLAPFPEQGRIVAKIESLFAKLDESIAALKRAGANLERYRASVLKAAVEGRLTERWRRENPPEETGEALLRRILAERRKRWEEEQLAKFAAKGKRPPRNWKAKYKEPVTPATSGLPGLPEGWSWATVDQVALEMRNGRSVRTREGGFPVLRLGAITGDVLDDRDFKHGDWGPKEAEPFRVRAGDFFVSRGNGSLDLVGRAAVADEGVSNVAFPDTMIRVKFACSKLLRARFVSSIWNSQFIRRQIRESARTSAGIYKISQADLRRLLLPVPPIREQDMIVGLHRVSESAQSHLENTLTVALRGTSVLRQSILKRAFEGRLVPQDPDDEPASVLLDRMRDETEAKITGGRSRPVRRGTWKLRENR